MEEEVYECLSCGSIHPLDEFTDTECDGDIEGTCPSCGVHSIILRVNTEDEDQDLDF